MRFLKYFEDNGWKSWANTSPNNNIEEMESVLSDLESLFEEPEINEHFKVKNITEDGMIDCAKNGGYVYATIIKDFPGNDPEEPLRVVSFEDGIVTIEYKGSEYETELKNIEKIDIPTGSTNKEV